MTATALIVAVLAASAVARPAPSLSRSTAPRPHFSRRDIPLLQPQILPSNGTDGDFDVLHHLAGISPYWNSEGVSLDSAPPDSCTVSSATYLLRHSNIYANDFDYEDILQPFISKLANFTSKGDFKALPKFVFLANWTSPITNATEEIEKMTPSGGDAAHALGKYLRTLYPTLIPNNTVSPTNGTYKIWTSDSERTLATSGAFTTGLFGTSYDSSKENVTIPSGVSRVVISEGEDESANSLTPHESCPAFDGSLGSVQSGAWDEIYTAPIIARLNAVVPAFNFTTNDIVAMQELCGYETVIKNSSDFCQAFEQEDWLGFEYSNDLMYFYSLGYGLDIAPVLGLPWVRASTDLLTSTTPASQSVYFSFTHREEPPFVLTALGLFNNSAYTTSSDVNSTMPSDRINYNRAWKTSEILPFLGHIALERLECSAPSSANVTSPTVTSYIRALVNSAVIPFPDCQSGPGESCPLADFSTYIQSKVDAYGDFVGKCGVNTTEVTNSTDILSIYGPIGNSTVNGTTAMWAW